MGSTKHPNWEQAQIFFFSPQVPQPLVPCHFGLVLGGHRRVMGVTFWDQWSNKKNRLWGKVLQKISFWAFLTFLFWVFGAAPNGNSENKKWPDYGCSEHRKWAFETEAKNGRLCPFIWALAQDFDACPHSCALFPFRFLLLLFTSLFSLIFCFCNSIFGISYFW